MSKELLTTQEMAEILKVSPRTFRDYIDEYELPFVKIGKRKRFVADEILKHLQSCGEKIEVPANVKSSIKPEIKSDYSEFYKELGLTK